MTARLVRRWRVWREKCRLTGNHVRQGYDLTAYHEELYREIAERNVP